MKKLAELFFPFFYTELHPAAIAIAILFDLYILANICLCGYLVFKAAERKGEEKAWAKIASALTYDDWNELRGKVEKMEREHGEKITL